MEVSTQIKEMLDLMLRPAFWVEDGIIRHINPAAAPLMLSEGQSIESMSLSGKEEYAQFTDGCLHMEMLVNGQPLVTTVIRRENGEIFLTEAPITASQFQVLSLAAMQLREPLAGLMAITEQMLPEANPKHAAQANRRLYQLLRVINNMSDVQRFYNPSACHMEYTEICSFLEEILEKADMLLSSIDIRIDSQIPRESIYTLADREQLERAIYNLLSNAARHSGSGCTIYVQLSRRGQRLYLSVQSSHPARNPIPIANYYTRFLREPSMEDITQGIGLGMVLIRAAASNHGGAMLIDQPDNKGARITVSLEIRQGKSDLVRSPILHVDYAGERDHGLLELSELLPAELYAME